jgi:alpha-L-fucosidase
MLVDIVSKNGNLLLNIPQRPDGTLDDECLFLLQRLAEWTRVNGEGVYATRPWKVAGEGPSKVTIEGFREEAVFWTEQDFRFTCLDGSVYAFLMKWPEGGQAEPVVVIRSLALGSVERVTSVALLGQPGYIQFEQSVEGLVVHLPALKPSQYAQCVRVALG